MRMYVGPCLLNVFVGLIYSYLKRSQRCDNADNIENFQPEQHTVATLLGGRLLSVFLRLRTYSLFTQTRQREKRLKEKEENQKPPLKILRRNELTRFTLSYYYYFKNLFQ